ncbi:efflux RND transporter permease subunit [Planctomycetota bacterium]
MKTQTDFLQNMPFTTRVVDTFLKGPFPVILMVIAIILGIAALYLTPREEDPQIVVPMADLYIHAPGLSAAEIERQITTRVEKMLLQIDGVEYVYSMSSPSRAIVTIRFFVGEDREDSLVKLYNKLHSNKDAVPPGVESWVLKPVEIDDVPVMICTLWSEDPVKYGPGDLARFAEEIEIQLQSLPDTNRTEIVGGLRREIRIEFDPTAMAAHQTTLQDIESAFGVSNTEMPAGLIKHDNRVITLDTGRFLASPESCGKLVVNVIDGEAVYLEDIARIVDGPREPDNYCWFGYGTASDNSRGYQDYYPALQISVAKKKGSNAVRVTKRIETRLQQLVQYLPSGVHYEITRNYGATANAKVNELVEALAIAVITVVLFLGWFLGWRIALIIALAIPICYGITLFINLLAGYTINRVTLFALILALGLLVDDPITDVENIERYLRMKKYSLRETILRAVQEVRPALILSTVAIILSFIPLKFITGMMGPYMAPMALNVPLTVIVSTLVAFCITPGAVFMAYEDGGFSQLIEAEGGLPPYTWSSPTGPGVYYPPNYGLNVETHTITGNTDGDKYIFMVVVQLQDSDDPPQVTSQTYHINVEQRLDIDRFIPSPAVTGALLTISGDLYLPDPGNPPVVEMTVQTEAGPVILTPTIVDNETLTVTMPIDAISGETILTVDTVELDINGTTPVILQVLLQHTGSNILPNAQVGVPYVPVQLTAIGGLGLATYTWSGTLPDFLTIAADGTISGTPDIDTEGTYLIMLTVFDGEQTVPLQYELTIDP